MNSLKLIALIGVAATSVAAHRHHDDESNNLLNQKKEFLTACAVEVPMCEGIIAQDEANKNFVIVEPTDPPSDPSEPIPSEPAADVARQCIQDSLAVCVPALDSEDPRAVVQCVIEHRDEIRGKFQDLSDECKAAFRDLFKFRRHAQDPQHKRHGHGDDDDDDDDDMENMHLSASGADIGACLQSHTQNLTAPCLAAVDALTVNASSVDWGFLDAEPEFEGRHHWWKWAGLFVMALVCCCCVRKCRNRKKCCRRNCSGNDGANNVQGVAPVAAPRSTVVNGVVTDDPEMARAIAMSLADSERRASAPPATAGYQPPRMVDVAYTGSNREALLQADVVPSDHYV